MEVKFRIYNVVGNNQRENLVFIDGIVKVFYDVRGLVIVRNIQGFQDYVFEGVFIFFLVYGDFVVQVIISKV